MESNSYTVNVLEILSDIFAYENNISLIADLYLVRKDKCDNDKAWNILNALI